MAADAAHRGAGGRRHAAPAARPRRGGRPGVAALRPLRRRRQGAARRAARRGRRAARRRRAAAGERQAVLRGRGGGGLAPPGRLRGALPRPPGRRPVAVPRRSGAPERPAAALLRRPWLRRPRRHRLRCQPLPARWPLRQLGAQPRRRSRPPGGEHEGGGRAGDGGRLLRLDAAAGRGRAARRWRRCPTFEDELRDELALAPQATEGGAAARYGERIALPSLNLRGLAAATVGETARNVIPPSATASFDLRLVAGEEPAAMLDLVAGRERKKKCRGSRRLAAPPAAWMVLRGDLPW